MVVGAASKKAAQSFRQKTLGNRSMLNTLNAPPHMRLSGVRFHDARYIRRYGCLLWSALVVHVAFVIAVAMPSHSMCLLLRFWGTPLPVWASEDMQEIVVVGSVKELEELSGHKVHATHLQCCYCTTVTTPAASCSLNIVNDHWTLFCALFGSLALV